MRLGDLYRFLNQRDGSLRRKTVRGGIWMALSTFVISTLAFFRTIFLARLLSPEIFGLWAICQMVIRGAEVFTQTGFAAALIHRQTHVLEARDTAFTLMVLRGILLTVAMVGIGPLVSTFFERHELTPLLSVLAFAFLFEGFRNINTVLQQKEMQFRLLSILQLSQTLFSFILAITLAYFLRSIWALVIAHLVSTLIGTILSFVIVPGRPQFSFKKQYAWELFHYGKFLTGLSVVVFLTSQIDNAVIAKLLGTEALGFYVVAYMLANLPATHFSKLLSNILFPAYSQLQNDLLALRNAFTDALTLVSLISVPVAVLFITFSTELISLLYGERWLPAASALSILAVFGAIRAISSLNGYLYNAIGKPNIPFYLNLTKLIIIAIAIVPAAIELGIVGVGLAITVPLIAQQLVSLSILTRLLETRLAVLLWPLMRYTLAGIVIAGLLIGLKSISYLSPILSMIVIGTLGVLLWYLLFSRDIHHLWRLATLKRQ